RASARRAWRSRSSARRRAVVSSHAPGRSGVPSTGQRSSARANASWTISSAASMSRTMRSTEATTRPHSCRNVCAIRSRTSRCSPPTSSDGTAAAPVAALHLPDRAQLDEAAFDQRHLLRPLHGFVPGITLDQVEAANRFLGLGERAVRHLVLTRLQPDAAAVGVRAKAFAVNHLAGRLQLLAEAAMAL